MTKQQHPLARVFPTATGPPRAHVQVLEAQSNLPQDMISQTRSMILEISAVAGPIISIPTQDKMRCIPQASHPMSVRLQMTRWGWVSIGFYRSMFLSKANPLCSTTIRSRAIGLQMSWEYGQLSLVDPGLFWAEKADSKQTQWPDSAVSNKAVEANQCSTVPKANQSENFPHKPD
jgi:hypothetical protein